MNRRHRLAVLAVCCCAILRAMPVSAQENQNVPAGPLSGADGVDAVTQAINRRYCIHIIVRQRTIMPNARM